MQIIILGYFICDDNVISILFKYKPIFYIRSNIDIDGAFNFTVKNNTNNYEIKYFNDIEKSKIIDLTNFFDGNDLYLEISINNNTRIWLY